VSTAHVSAATAALLDLWATHLSPQAPLTVATTVHGWFVSTRPLSPSEVGLLPGDLRQLLSHGRSLGFDYVVLDCDAAVTHDLPQHSW
jgi:hypothetical protein